MDDRRLRSITTRLEEERAAAERQLRDAGAIGQGSRAGIDESFADAGQATAERSELFSLVEHLQETIADVDAAFVRIEDGTYERCERCGREIPFERLEAVPTARLCVDCKQAQQRSA